MVSEAWVRVYLMPVHASAAPSPRPFPPLRRGKGEFDRAPAGEACVPVKPHGVYEAFRFCCGGFTRSQRGGG